MIIEKSGPQIQKDISDFVNKHGQDVLISYLAFSYLPVIPAIALMYGLRRFYY